MQTWEKELEREVNLIEVFSGLSGDASFFVFNDKCYILDSSNYLVYDGTTVSPVTPYIPTLNISRDPAGGGTRNEDFNLLGAAFKDSFSADGTATIYQLSLTGLDATAVTANVNGSIMNEGAGFSVNRATGAVTFTTAPAKGTNNVIITAYKTISGNPEKIKKCRFSIIYGGSNDTRVFLSGNPDLPNFVYRLGLDDPTYAPDLGYYKFPDKVMGFSKQYDSLLIHRENGVHQVTFQIDDTGVSFPSKPINDQVGTLASKSIQIIENNPVILTKNGVFMLVSSNVRDERNMAHISENVDDKLLREPNLSEALSIDFDKKYWLFVNGNVYVLDYTQKSPSNPFGEWYVYDNFNVSSLTDINGSLYFGSSVEGIVYRIKSDNDTRAYNDDFEPINAYWKSKHLDFGVPERRKLVEKVFYSLKPSGKTSLDLYYVSDRKESDLVKTSRMDIFDFRTFDFANFTFLTSTFPQETMAKIKAKKITQFQLIIKNDKLDESLGVLSLGIKYRYLSEVK